MSRLLKNALLFSAWLSASGMGLLALNRFATTAGSSAEAPTVYPFPLKRENDDRAMLLVFLHPKCSCSEATLTELKKVMDRTRGMVNVQVHFTVSSTLGQAWSEDSLWQRALKNQEMKAIADYDGLMAKIFHSSTSGQVLLYDSRGILVFQGGITSARGHEGDNSGEESIIALILNRRSDSNSTAVYGCDLFHRRADENPFGRPS